MWNKFTASYCRIEGVCNQGVLNGIGWVIFGILAMVVTACIFIFIAGRLEAKYPLIWE